MALDWRIIRGCYLYFKLGLAALYDAVPTSMYVMLLVVFVIVTVVFFILFESKKALRLSAWLMFVEYLILLLSSTVLFRGIKDSCGFNFTPFWSYKAVQDGTLSLVAENLLNVIAFIPVGFLLGCAIKRIGWRKAMLISCGISLSVELLQFLFSRGFAELDDVIHNTIGALIGYGLFKSAIEMRRFIINRL